MAIYYVDIETATTEERYRQYLERDRVWRSTLRPTRNAEDRAMMMAKEPKMPHGDDPARDKIVTIQFRKLSDLAQGEVAPLIILREWQHPQGERGILHDFNKATGYFDRRWDCVKTGWNLDFEKEWFKHKGTGYGLIPWGKAADFSRPVVDVMHVGLLMNADRSRPLDAKGNVPNMFYGASLDRFSRKRSKGAYITQFYHERRYGAIDDYVRQEADAFVELWQTLIETMPQVWRKQVAPRVGR